MSDTTIKERPFNCTGDEVRAIRDGRMTMFRRPVEPQPDWGRYEITQPWHVSAFDVGGRDHRNPFGEVGDRLWVREAWAAWYQNNCNRHREQDEDGGCDEHCNQTYVAYRATPRSGYRPIPDKAEICFLDESTSLMHNSHLLGPWRSPVTMPREASRLLLELTDVRVERLQEISASDVKAEGVVFDPMKSSLPMASTYYQSLNDAGHISTYRDHWNARYATPKPVRSGGIVTHYVSYPWEDVQEVREHRGLPWYVRGNSWVWVNTCRRVEG